MTRGVKNFQSGRLREARLARGMTMKALGDLVGVTTMAISRYESGQDNPTAENLDSLANSLKFPLEFFSKPLWTESLEPVFWRSRTSETKLAREMTEQRMRWLCEAFAFLQHTLDFPAVHLPEVEVPKDFRLITPEMIERAAEHTRMEWGIRHLPIPDMFLALENIGIPVAAIEIPSDKQDGFCFRSGDLGRPFVGVNTYNVSSCRARFDAAHELGHLVLHRHVKVEQERNLADKKLLEQQAHRFAGALLFPRDSFYSEAGIISLDYFCSLKPRWKVSIAAMINRASDLDLIDTEERKQLFIKLTKRKWRGVLREPLDAHSEIPLERPRMLRRAVDALFRTGMFGIDTLRLALPLPRNEIESLLGLGETFFEIKPNIVPFVKPKADVLNVYDVENGNLIPFSPRKRS